MGTACSKMSMHPAASAWIPDPNADHCMVCDQEFSVLLRKHHCRACGSIICGNCSSHFEFLPQYGYSLRHPVRICDTCALRKKNVVDLEKEMFIICKKAKFRSSPDAGIFLVEFASKLRQAKTTEGFSENLVKFASEAFAKFFMTVYDPLNKEINDILSNPIMEDAHVDNVLDRAMFLLRSWKNLENDIPGVSAKAFLNKVELIEKWRTGADESAEKMPRVTSSPCLTVAQQSFHRHRPSFEHTPSSSGSFEGFGSATLRSSSRASFGHEPGAMEPPSPKVLSRRSSGSGSSAARYSEHL